MGTLKALKVGTDANQRLVEGSVSAGGHVDIRVLAANTAEVHTVPSGAKFVTVTVTGNTFINFNAAAAVAAADVTDGSASIMLVNAVPRTFKLTGISTIGVIASAIQTVTLEFFK